MPEIGRAKEGKREKKRKRVVTLLLEKNTELQKNHLVHINLICLKRTTIFFALDDLLSD